MSINQIDYYKEELERITRLLVDLTPGGSDFVNEPDNCIRYIRNKLLTNGEIIKSFKRQRDAALEDLYLLKIKMKIGN